jgi:RNA polymerase sigma factor (sigma-70 family)
MDFSREEPDAVLLAATLTEPEAFAVFYRRYERLVLAYLLRRTGDPEIAADLTAETFASALRSSERYRPLAPTAVAWLLTIAQRTLGASLRRGRVEAGARRVLGIRDAVCFDGNELDRVEALVSLDGQALALLDELPQDQRDAVRAHVLDERSYHDIAGELELSELVVRKRVSRGLRTLRHGMECAQ